MSEVEVDLFEYVGKSFRAEKKKKSSEPSSPAKRIKLNSDEDKEENKPTLNRRISFSIPLNVLDISDDDEKDEKPISIIGFKGEEGDKCEFFVKWKNAKKKDSWVKSSDIDKKLIEKFEKRKDNKPSNYIDFFYDGLLDDFEPTVQQLASQISSKGLSYIPVLNEKIIIKSLYKKVNTRFKKLYKTLSDNKKLLSQLKEGEGFKELKFFRGAYYMTISKEDYPELDLSKSPLQDIIQQINSELILTEMNCLILHHDHSEDFKREAEENQFTELKPSKIQVFIPLVHFTQSKGCPEYIPHSHHLWESIIQPITIKANSGAAIIFDHRTQYRFLPSTDFEGGHRILVQLTYSTENKKKDQLPSIATQE